MLSLSVDDQITPYASRSLSIVALGALILSETNSTLDESSELSLRDVSVTTSLVPSALVT